MFSNQFDEQLQQLAIEAKQHPPLSPQRQLALNKLVKAILQSYRLCHPQSGLWKPSLYEDLYNEALQKTFLEICRRIDSYNLEHPVMAWVNFVLSMRFRDVVEKYRNKGITSIPSSIQVISIDKLDNLTTPEQTLSNYQMLRQFLKDDPENLLKNEHVQGHPQANFQYIAIAKFVEEKTWKEISEELNGISVQTLCSFFHRQLRNLIPYFQKYLQCEF